MQATIPPPLPTPQATATTVQAGQSVTPIAAVPTTVAEVLGLREKRSELSRQLESTAGTRARLSRQLRGKEGVDRAGIESRIGVLDKRMMQLESDIAETGRQLTMAPNALVAAAGSSRQFSGMDPGETAAALGAVFMIFVLAPIAFAAARMMWKRTNRPVKAAISDDASRRLERLEQGMDAIAIEIERVSEGQRFVTRLLSESHGAPLAVSQRIAEESKVGER